MTNNTNENEVKDLSNNNDYIFHIIEDDIGLCKLIKNKIKTLGQEVIISHNANDALEKINGNYNEFLLIDYKLPRLTGKQLIEELIKKYQRTPNFIAMTGYGEITDAVELMKIGARDYLIKDSSFLEILPEKIKVIISQIESEEKLKQTEKELSLQNELLSITSKIAKVGGWEIDLINNKVVWTDETKRIHEVDQNYLPTLDEAISFFHGDNKTIIDNAVKEAINKGIDYDIELELTTKKGNKKAVNSIGTSKFENGKCIRLNGIIQDITKRKELEGLVLKTRDFLQETERIGKIGGWEFNPITFEQSWSQEIFRILEYDNFDKAPAVPEGINFIDEEFRFDANKAIEKAITKGEPYDREWKVTTQKGNKKWVRAIANCEVTDGKTVNIRGSFQDITKHKESEEELRSLNQQLSANEQQLRASNQQLMAHEQQLRAVNEELIVSQEEILQNIEKAESYLNIVAEIVLKLNAEGNITLINDSGAELLGYSKSELLGKNWFKTCLPKETRDEVKEVFNRIITGEISTLNRYESEIITSKGEKRNLLWHNTVLKDDVGNIIGTLSSAEDLTDISMKEEKLVELNRQLTLAQNIAKLGYWTFDPETQTPTWTDEVFIMHDIPKDHGELNYLEQKNIIHPDDWDYFDNAVQKLINDDIPYDVQYRIRKSNGNIVWLRTRGFKNKQEIHGVVQDITDLKIIEIELEEQKILFENMFNTIPDAIVVADSKRNLKMVNKGYEEITGFSKEESIGKPTKLFYASKQVYEERGKTIYNEKSEIANDFYVVNYKRKDGREFPGETFGSKLVSKNGEYLGNLGVIKDITERLNYIDELNKAKEKAEESDRLKSAFLANMSHEIRTPMNGILGFTNLLQTPNLTGEKQSKYVDIIKKSGLRMLNTVNDIIEVSKIETELITLDINTVNLYTLIDGLFEFFKPEVNKKGIELSHSLNVEDSFINIQTDENKFASIITNLIKNAIKFTKEGSIELSCIKENDKLKFSVKDTGIGIPFARQKAIFERFTQADIEDKQALEGSGLGLTITKSYVEMLGGKIWVESEPGKGSTFHFTIDYIKDESMAKSEENKTENIKSIQKKINILVAEDDDVSFELISSILSFENYSLIRAVNGKETVKVFEENPNIDLILMDIRMPLMDGLEATSIIRKSNKNIPIIAQTAFALAGDKDKAIDVGCNDYISKPIMKNELMSIIEQYF